MSRARFVALAVLAAALLAAALPAALVAADDIGLTVPSDQSAGDQYVETLPTTKGPRAPGRRKHAKKLSKDVTTKLQQLGGSDAATLKALATSPALGAPTGKGDAQRKSANRGSKRKGSHGRRSGSGKRHGSSPAVPSAAINAVDGGESGLGWLVLAILAISALSLGAVGYQRRRDKGSTE